MVYLLNELAEAEEFFGLSSEATSHLELAESFANAINKYLWSNTENDHYVCCVGRRIKRRWEGRGEGKVEIIIK
jgi:hypothetical protein